MKNLALGLVLGASLVSTAASASSQRPTHMAFSAPRATAAASRAASPQVPAATPRVAKRQKAIGGIPLYVPLIGVVGIVGIVAAVSGGKNGSPG